MILGVGVENTFTIRESEPLSGKTRLYELHVNGNLAWSGPGDRSGRCAAYRDPGRYRRSRAAAQQLKTAPDPGQLEPAGVSFVRGRRAAVDARPSRQLSSGLRHGRSRRNQGSFSPVSAFTISSPALPRGFLSPCLRAADPAAEQHGTRNAPCEAPEGQDEGGESAHIGKNINKCGHSNGLRACRG